MVQFTYHIYMLQHTLLHCAHTVPVICTKIQMHFDDWMEMTMHGALNLLLLQASEVNAGKFLPSILFSDEAEQPNSHRAMSGLSKGMGQNLDVLLL